MRDLENRLGPRGEQSLHIQFRRRLQELAIGEPQRFDVELWDHLVGHQRRFDFQESTLMEELAAAA